MSGFAALAMVVAALSFYGNRTIDENNSGRLGGFVSWDSGLYPGLNTWPHLQWLDNDTVVFVGDAQGKPMTGLEASRRRDAIIVWRLGGPPVVYTDERWVKGGNKTVCAADGVLVYPVGYETGGDGGRRLKLEEGLPGQTRERIIDYPKRPPIPGLYPVAHGSDRPCDYYHDPKMIGRFWSADHDRKFYLDFGPFRQLPPPHDPVMLLSPAMGKSAIALPVRPSQAIFTCTQYHNFSGLFYLEDCAFGGGLSFEKVRCRPFWTVNPTTAQTERHCVPFDPVLGDKWDQLLPTAKGIFFSTSQKLGEGPAGLFWPQSTSGPPVVEGFVENVTVSPNGCRLAFSYAKTLKDTLIGTSGRYSVVAIDICEERK
jgi:hypothetical protein